MLPPADLAARVVRAGEADPLSAFDALGQATSALVRRLLPLGWSWESKRVLDFGCGPGTVLRHLVDEARGAEIYGCDVHEPSIAWLERELSPPLNVFVNGHSPPLPLPDGHVDLILATSVFGHITDEWSSWLLELHRVLDDEGVMIATLMGEGVAEAISGEPWSEEAVGMNVYGYGRGFEDGCQGPMVLHSPWWVERHWGRIFDIVEIVDDAAPGRHFTVKLRKRPVRVSADRLEQPDPDEPREATALQHQIRQLQRELGAARAARDAGRSR
jgi:SAM-dependent methyltransferase